MAKTKIIQSDKSPAKGKTQKSAKALKVKKKDFDNLLWAMSGSAKEKSESKE